MERKSAVGAVLGSGISGGNSVRVENSKMGIPWKEKS